MRRFTLAAVVVLFFAGLFAVATAGQQADVPKVQKWEYKSGFALNADSLNQIGDEGWEAYQIVEVNQSTMVYFKRPKQ